MSRSRSGKRDNNTIASDPLLGLMAPPVSRPRTALWDGAVLAQELQSLNEVEDRRTFHPEPLLRPLLTAVGRRAVTRTKNQFDFTRPLRTVVGIVGHKHPLKTALICARRKARREVLHAIYPFKLGKRGRGGGRHKRSSIRC